MKPAALYMRVSTAEQTTANQRDALEQLARSRGFEPVVYEETGSAVKHRPVFERLMADAHAGKLGAVVVVALDRLGRRMVDVVQTVSKLTTWKVRVVSAREPWVEVEGPTRDLLTAVMGWVAEYERSVLVERTRAGLDRARRQGKRLGRPRRSPLALEAAALQVQAGRASVAAAAREAGLGASTLRRYLRTKNVG